MIRHLYISALCLYSCLSLAEDTNMSTWRDAAKKKVDNFRQASGADKRYLIASYQLSTSSHYDGEFYCDTSFTLTGHKFVDGTACQITYNFIARNDFNGLQLQGSFMKSQTAETCEEAEKICKQVKLNLKENGNQLEIIHQDKLIARIIYKNDLPGFVPE